MAPPPLPKPSPPMPSAHPEAVAASRPDASFQADGTTKPAPSSSMLPSPPLRGISLPSEAEPDASTGVIAVTSPSVSGSSAYAAGIARGDSEMDDAVPPEQWPQQPRQRAPYAIPDWSATPEHPFYLEVIEAGIPYDNLDVSKKGAYTFGRDDLCDFALEHPTISPFHAVLQFGNDGRVFLYDLGSAQGSSINKTQIKKKIYVKISVGDFIQFGQSSRMYFFQGPAELMPPADEAGNSHGGNTQPRAPYTVPKWSATPEHPFFLEVLKNGVISEELDVSKKGAYIFGQDYSCDFVLEHPTISPFHAVLQFSNDGQVFLYDLGSTNGSSINKMQTKKDMYTSIHVGDLIQFGQSSCRFIFQGPCELISPKLHDAKIGQDMFDREASRSEAKIQAALAEGISWGMSEDAPEEFGEDEAEEITWQTYKGQLTDRQEKTRGKIIKRMEKVANMKKEIDAIRVEDISPGGLTQGQQTKIAQNEQRISQIMEELENLEVTLNDSIQESLGARAAKPKCGSHKASLEEKDVASGGLSSRLRGSLPRKTSSPG